MSNKAQRFYHRLMEHKPTVLKTITNQLGQEIELVEHPNMGELTSVIAVSHTKKEAGYTEFFDTDDFYPDSEYNPVFLNGELVCFFEVPSETPMTQKETHNFIEDFFDL